LGQLAKIFKNTLNYPTTPLFAATHARAFNTQHFSTAAAAELNDATETYESRVTRLKEQVNSLPLRLCEAGEAGSREKRPDLTSLMHRSYCKLINKQLCLIN